MTAVATLSLPLSRQAKVLLKISFLTTFAESMLVPIYSTFTEEVGGNILDAGIAFAVFSIATGVAVIVVGTQPWFQVHLMKFLMAGFALSAVCDLAYIFVRNTWQLFAVQIAIGLATGFIEPAWDSLFTEDVEAGSARHWALWAGGSHLATGFAAIAGGLIVSLVSFNALFVSMCVVDLLAMAVTWRSQRTASA